MDMVGCVESPHRAACEEFEGVESERSLGWVESRLKRRYWRGCSDCGECGGCKERSECWECNEFRYCKECRACGLCRGVTIVYSVSSVQSGLIV